jgi:hypothetical protein
MGLSSADILATGRSSMAKRRRAVQQLWNRFMAAVLFVLGAALNTAAPPETQETRVSRAEATQLEAAHTGRQLSAALGAKLDGAGNDGGDEQPALAPPVFTFAVRQAVGSPAISRHPARLTKRLVRDGQSRAPPSA